MSARVRSKELARLPGESTLATNHPPFQLVTSVTDRASHPGAGVVTPENVMWTLGEIAKFGSPGI